MTKTKTAKKLPLSSVEIGVMQGRLLPKYQGRYQAHPVGYWQDEFEIAAELNLSLIEFILDLNEIELNPLMSQSGCETINRLSTESGVKVKTVCADYLMDAPIHSPNAVVAKSSCEILKTLIANSEIIGVTDIIIPLVDQSSVASRDSQSNFITQLEPFLEIVDSAKINLNLETDLNPRAFKSFLTAIGSNRVTVNYDTGNSAGIGYKPDEEFAAYGSLITDIHIKDRVKDGSSVFLGQGDADFETFFKCVTNYGYSGPFILQAYRDDEGLEIFKQQLAWFRESLKILNEEFES